MKVGESFLTKGYDLVAMATSDDGEVIVLNNNSTHYLVAVRQGDSDEQATLVGSYSYSYGSEIEAERAHVQSMLFMVREASDRCYSRRGGYWRATR